MKTTAGCTTGHRSGMPRADRECWNRIYSRASLRDLPWFPPKAYPPLVRAVSEGNLEPPGPLLDVGCGLGANAVWLGSKGFRVTGIDIAPGAIAAAQARRTSRDRSVTFLADDILASSLPSARFRAAVDIGCFQTLPPRTRGAYVENLARVLCSEAILLLFWVAREEAGSWGPPHRLSVGDVVEPFEPKFRIDRIEHRPRRVLLTNRIRKSTRPLTVLAGYTARLVRRRGPQPPPR
jgi:SAM-dependent methyltransferase